MKAKAINTGLGTFNWKAAPASFDDYDSVWYPCILKTAESRLPKTDWDDIMAFSGQVTSIDDNY